MRKRLYFLVLSHILVSGTLAQANEVVTEYQLGDDWGKVKVTAEKLRTETPFFKRMALATAHTGGATGFYLGRFLGKDVMATNHHVFPYAHLCIDHRIDFPLQKSRAYCTEFIGTWPSIDLSLFVIKPASVRDEQNILPYGQNFDFDHPIQKGQPITTIGFGVGQNPMQDMVAGQDNDCKVFSNTGEYRFMADSDQINPGDYQAWSFATGCDASHGDSGSAMMNRETGNIMGIIWTGRIPKDPKVQNSSYLQNLYQSNGQEIWEELTYAVPAQKIKEYLVEQLSAINQDYPITQEDTVLLKAVLGL